MDKNRFEATGEILYPRSIQTKTGTAMATWALQINQRARINCVAFGDPALAVLDVPEHTEVGVSGQFEIHSYQKDGGEWVNTPQVKVWAVEVAGITTSFKKRESPGHGQEQQPRNSERYIQEAPEDVPF